MRANVEEKRDVHIEACEAVVARPNISSIAHNLTLVRLIHDKKQRAGLRLFALSEATAEHVST